MLRSFKLKESIMINLSLIYIEFCALLLEESNCFFCLFAPHFWAENGCVFLEYQIHSHRNNVVIMLGVLELTRALNEPDSKSQMRVKK